METCETVKVVNPADKSDYMIINKIDITPEHKEWKEKKRSGPKVTPDQVKTAGVE